MPLTMVGPEEAVVVGRTTDEGEARTWSEYFGRATGRGDSPQGFVVPLHNRFLGAHFHPVDQFQILLGVPGATYQREPVAPMMVHYADAYVTYGPLIGEDAPLRFYTLRALMTEQVLYMPDERKKLLWRGKRNRHVDFDHLTPGEFPGVGEVSVDTIWEREDDGLEGLAVTAGPRATIVIPGTSGTNGQYVFVADGSLARDGRSFPIESLGWQGPEEDGTEVTAGDGGVRLFVLRFPTPTSVEQHLLAEKVGASA